MPVKPNQSVVYEASKNLDPNQWSLGGKWLISSEKASLIEKNGKVLFRFHARDLHLVLGTTEKVKFKVSIDGHAPGLDHGSDIDENGMGVVDSHRLYQLIRQRNKKDITDHIFEIEFFKPM